MQIKYLSQIIKTEIAAITVACTIFSCSQQADNSVVSTDDNLHIDQVQSNETQTPSNIAVNALEQTLQAAGLIDIHEIDSLIMVDLRYSTLNNFVGVDVYGDLENCYLQPQVAQMLGNAQKLLSERTPGYRLLTFDCARPLQVQQILWDTLQKPEDVKHLYVADPELGSIHNYGSAIDLTVADEKGNPLDMGTDYDHFSELAYPSKEEELLELGTLSKTQVDNRKLLRAVMMEAGFSPIDTEWWHFNAFSRSKASEMFEIIK